MAVKEVIQSRRNSNFGRGAPYPVFLSVTATLPQLHKFARTQTVARTTVTWIQQEDVMIFVIISVFFQTDGREPRNFRRSLKVFHLRTANHNIRTVWVHPVVYWWDPMCQYNDRLTQLFTKCKYKYIWLWLQCFDPYLGHCQTYIMNIDLTMTQIRVETL
jgi:hypothetical protein